MIFTTSWDDGYAADMRIAQLLERHNATGTFYVCPYKQHNQEMLTNEQIKELDNHHEVGAHSISHHELAYIDIAEASKEISDSKQWIEQITGHQCSVFCYPYGCYNSDVRDAVVAAGFLGARTVKQFHFNATDLFELHTSLHLLPPWQIKYSRFWRVFKFTSPIRLKWKKLNELQIPLRSRKNWQQLARALFTHALETGEPFFHLWGHAFELDRYDLWDEFDNFLAFVGDHSVTNLTNGQLVQALKKQPSLNPASY